MSMKIWLHDHAPKTVRDWMDRAATPTRHISNKEIQRLLPPTDAERLAAIGRTLTPLSSLDVRQTAEQILTCGFLQHEAVKLGKISSEIVGALQPKSESISDRIKREENARILAHEQKQALREIKSELSRKPETDKPRIKVRAGIGRTVEAPRLKI